MRWTFDNELVARSIYEENIDSYTYIKKTCHVMVVSIELQPAGNLNARYKSACAGTGYI